MSHRLTPEFLDSLRPGAMNLDDMPVDPSRIADQILADAARPEGIGAPTGPRSSGDHWRGLDRHSDPGHWRSLGGRS